MTYRDVIRILPEANDPERGGWTGEPRVPARGSFAIINRWQHPTTSRWFFLGRMRLPVSEEAPALVSGGAYEAEWGVDPDGAPTLVRSGLRRFRDAHPTIWERFMPTASIRPPNNVFLGDTPEPEDW